MCLGFWYWNDIRISLSLLFLYDYSPRFFFHLFTDADNSKDHTHLRMQVCNSGTPQCHRSCNRLISRPLRISSLSISTHRKNQTEVTTHNTKNISREHSQSNADLVEALNDRSQELYSLGQKPLLNLKNSRPVHRENLDDP